MLLLVYEMKFLLSNYKLPPEPLTRGLPPPDPRILCPLSSTEFVEHPPPEQNSCVRHCVYHKPPTNQLIDHTQ